MTARLTLGSALFIMASALVYQVGCGGGPAAPMPPGGGGGGGGANMTVSIVANNGSQSFSPNPVSVANGQTLAWRNNDPAGTTHHIVADNGSFDSGLVNPGGTSNIVMPSAGPVPYHCAIHPTMVGTINGAQNGGGPGGGYGGYHGGY